MSYTFSATQLAEIQRLFTADNGSKGVSVAFAVEEVNRLSAYSASLKENIGVEHRPQ